MRWFLVLMLFFVSFAEGQQILPFRWKTTPGPVAPFDPDPPFNWGPEDEPPPYSGSGCVARQPVCHHGGYYLINHKVCLTRQGPRGIDDVRVTGLENYSNNLLLYYHLYNIFYPFANKIEDIKYMEDVPYYKAAVSSIIKSHTCAPGFECRVNYYVRYYTGNPAYNNFGYYEFCFMAIANPPNNSVSHYACANVPRTNITSSPVTVPITFDVSVNRQYYRVTLNFVFYVRLTCTPPFATPQDGTDNVWCYYRPSCPNGGAFDPTRGVCCL